MLSSESDASRYLSGLSRLLWRSDLLEVLTCRIRFRCEWLSCWRWPRGLGYMSGWNQYVGSKPLGSDVAVLSSMQMLNVGYNDYSMGLPKASISGDTVNPAT